MAKDTSVDLRNQVIYQVFPRQFSDTANFKGVTKAVSYTHLRAHETF